MRYNIQNYKFFKSYRFPIHEGDKVNAEVITFERENVKTNNVQIDSINLSGLNFISTQKYSIGENVKIKIQTNRIFNNWDFELTGRIIRSFIYCEDVTKTIYGISISPDSQTTVLKYFLKDFLSHYKTAKLKDKLFQICQNKIKISKDDGVELFSLFQSLIERAFKGKLTTILSELPTIFHCENYHIYLFNSKTKDFEVDHTNSDHTLLGKTFNGLLNEAYFNKVIINKSFNDQSATGVDFDIKNILLAPLVNYNGESIGALCLSNTLSGDKFNITMLENIKIVSGLISYFYNSKNNSGLETVKNKLPNHYIFSDRSHTGLAIINTLNTIKNTRENLYIHGEAGVGKLEYAKYVCSENSLIIDFEESENQSFEFIEQVSNNGINDLIVKNIEKLSLENQAIFYNLISSLKLRIITIASNDLKALEKNDYILTDLYNHITTVKLNIPPLRLRRAEIVEIAQYYIQFECKKRDMENKKISQETINKLESAKWDINNQELHALIVKAILKLNKKADNSKQVLQIPIKERQSDTIVDSDKNSQLQEYILNTLNSCDKSVAYSKTEKIFVESLMTKKAS
ncbi:hypothetical protein DAY19_11130 [Halobacteriovorax vibrionivorans]|uniref:Sigma-54 factor interaction domain-containing protein n=1 Tax=Halobacteriovorax vibrionivorans TaxID=2152716 RepID=A0ABY0ICZ5_9BACT|nr:MULTISPECIES: hypothetical protein [Halobacteriovorax]RZF20532.1 hypothetical protein DAY19_11130 [Halobacteriovorax vibrionivorans]TGD47445.1 hypothetical protein EP118_07660 [Halobacteriovorax sp. Y22]